MSSFEVRRPHTMEKQELRDMADGLADQLASIHRVETRWNGDCMSVRGSGVDGKLELSDNEVVVRVRLGLLAAAFKPALQKEVTRYLDECLG